jgi:predicted GIY-YIG superfamily endonuclease
MAFLYWIHNDSHTDMTKEGYIGVSYRPHRRLWEHKKTTENPALRRAFEKYQVKMTILLEAEEDYCYEIEAKLRPSKKIGWNIAEGGFKPPNLTGRKQTEEHKRNSGYAKRGRKLGPQSEESKLKKSIALKKAYAEGRRATSPEHGRRLGLSNRGRKVNGG